MLANPLALDGIKGGFTGRGDCCSGGASGVNGVVELTPGLVGVGARADERGGATWG